MSWERILGTGVVVASFLPQQPPQAVGLSFVSPTHVLCCPSKSALGKGSRQGRVRAQIPQPSNSEPTHGAARCLAPSRGEAAQLGLGWFTGQDGHFLKHFQHFQHFLKGTAVSGAGPAWVTAKDAQQGDAGTALSEYH